MWKIPGFTSRHDFAYTISRFLLELAALVSFVPDYLSRIYYHHLRPLQNRPCVKYLAQVARDQTRHSHVLSRDQPVFLLIPTVRSSRKSNSAHLFVSSASVARGRCSLQMHHDRRWTVCEQRSSESSMKRRTERTPCRLLRRLQGAFFCGAASAKGDVFFFAVLKPRERFNRLRGSKTKYPWMHLAGSPLCPRQG